MEQYAYFLNRLKEMKEGSSNVLENSLVLLGSNISAGQQHGPRNIPIVLAGNAGGKVRTGRHIKANGTPVSHLHRSILDAMGVDGKIGEGREKLRNI